MENNNDIRPLEVHPWAPYIPSHARVLIMGTFPPGQHRWCMDFYYPNRTNDFWKIIGLIFFGNPGALLIPGTKDFDLQRIKAVLDEHGIALHDTAHAVRRLKGNASDKFLEIVEPVDLRGLLLRMPECHTIATTGEKAAGVIAALTDTELPKMGTCVEAADGLSIWRMPSTSRAYPLPLDKKAAHYERLFRAAGCIQ